ncbi:MAG: hypothetical protein ACREI2_03520 [Nitrospiraceae bacterium]
MRLFRHLLWVGLVLAVSGCALFEGKETTFLRSAQDRATQEEVRQRLGPPQLATSTQSAESVWVYQVRQQQPGSRINAPGLWCDEYVLTFDSQAVLRRWTHRSYFHGGEVMSTYCVADGYKPTS